MWPRHAPRHGWIAYFTSPPRRLDHVRELAHLMLRSCATARDHIQGRRSLARVASGFAPSRADEIARTLRPSAVFRRSLPRAAECDEQQFVTSGSSPCS